MAPEVQYMKYSPGQCNSHGLHQSMLKPINCTCALPPSCSVCLLLAKMLFPFLFWGCPNPIACRANACWRISTLYKVCRIQAKKYSGPRRSLPYQTFAHFRIYLFVIADAPQSTALTFRTRFQSLLGSWVEKAHVSLRHNCKVAMLQRRQSQSILSDTGYASYL